MLLTGNHIVLCRHGVTDFTASGRWDGRGRVDPTLNAEGHARARDLATRARAFIGDAPEVRVVSSFLRRTKEAAAPMAELFGTGVTPRRVWDELAFGEWDGLTSDGLHGEEPDELLWFWGDRTLRVPDGKSHVNLHTRAHPAFKKFMGFGGTTVVVTHWGPVMSRISLVLGIDLLPARRPNLAPASVTSFMVTEQSPQVEFINDLEVRMTPPENI